MKWTISLLVMSLALNGLSALASETVDTGKVYEKGSNRKNLLFTLKRVETHKGDTAHVTETFTDPEGKEAVRMDGDFKDGKIYNYSIDEFQTGVKGTIVLKDNHAYFTYKEPGKDEKKSDEKVDGVFVVGLSFKNFIKENWDKLLKGDDAEMRFGVPDRLETVGFKFFKNKEAKIDGKDVVIFEMKPTSFVISALVKPLFFFYDKNTGQLLEFVGRTIPKKKEGDSFKDLDAETVYDVR
jgi:hypothetical protein